MCRKLLMLVLALVATVSVSTVREASASHCTGWDCLDKYCTYCVQLTEADGWCDYDWNTVRPCCTGDPNFCPF